MISEAGSPSLKKGKEAMTEPTMETLARRLDQAEREDRRLKQAGVVALVVIAAVMLVAMATPPVLTKVVEAEKFVLKDIHGKVRALAWANSRRGPS